VEQYRSEMKLETSFAEAYIMRFRYMHEVLKQT
jgi:hypothetical protein